MSNTTGANAGYGNFTNLTANLPWFQTPSYLVLVSRERLIQNFEYGLISTKWSFKTEMVSGSSSVALPFQVPLQYLLLLYLV
jgi:hypothetical protein